MAKGRKKKAILSFRVIGFFGHSIRAAWHGGGDNGDSFPYVFGDHVVWSFLELALGKYQSCPQWKSTIEH